MRRVAQNYERMRANGMSITRTVAPALAAKFKESAPAVIAEWEAKSGAEGREVLARFRKEAASRRTRAVRGYRPQSRDRGGLWQGGKAGNTPRLRVMRGCRSAKRQELER